MKNLFILCLFLALIYVQGCAYTQKLGAAKDVTPTQTDFDKAIDPQEEIKEEKSEKVSDKESGLHLTPSMDDRRCASEMTPGSADRTEECRESQELPSGDEVKGTAEGVGQLLNQ